MEIVQVEFSVELKLKEVVDVEFANVVKFKLEVVFINSVVSVLIVSIVVFIIGVVLCISVLTKIKFFKIKNNFLLIKKYVYNQFQQKKN